ncbi:MAG: SDR family oxidoreductase [Ignavibacteria bacterium]|nr:SDR family oxidoreductase [Ignavibacteria bacterium]
MNRLKNKIVFISGASSGIGMACAHAFAPEGAKLILAARRKERLDQLAVELKEKFNTEAEILSFDIQNYKEIKESFASLPEEWKDIDILINSAGLAKGMQKLNEGSPEDWDVMIDTNVKGLLYLTREVLPYMVKRESGHIINLGSTAGHDVYPLGNVYCATKFAVNAISQSLRIDLLDKSIKVSSVDPGMVETEFSVIRFFGDVERAKNVYKGVEPLTPQDVADAILYCATRPKHVNINEIILTPIAQAQSNFVVRKAT